MKLEAEASELRGDPGSSPYTIYGREADLNQLLGGLSAASEGMRQLALVGGESGIGKSTLVEALAWHATAAGVSMLVGRCYDLAMTPPYGAWLDLFRAYQASHGGHQPPLLAQAAAGFQITEDEVFEDVAAFLLRLAESSTLLVVLEDQHWADTASLDLLRYLLRVTREAPILYVVTYRDVELTPQYPLYRYLPVLVRESQPIRMDLRRLERGAVRDLVRDRYGLADADAGRLVDYLSEFAEGNPFFIEELLRALEHERILDTTAGGWQLGELRALRLPPLVRQVVDSRVGRLDDEARLALQVASVIGTEISLDLWQMTLGATSGDALVRPIEQALTAGLIVERRDGMGFSFSHSLVRETLYHSLLPPRRQSWHRRAGEVLAAQPAPDSSVVAAHFQAARDARAVEWLIRAGDEAVQVSALQAAAERYKQALQLLQDERSDRRGWLLCALAHTYRYSEPDRALRYLGEARDLLAISEDRALATAVLWNRARVRGFVGENTMDDLDDAVAAYDEMAPEDRGRFARLGRRFGGIQGPFSQWLGHHGRYREGYEVAVEAIEALDEMGPPPASQERGHALLGKALAETATEHPEQAERSFLAAYEQFASARNHFMAAASLKWELIDFVLPYRADAVPRREQIVRQYRDHWRAARDHRLDESGEPYLPLFPEMILAGRWDQAEQSAHTYIDIIFLQVDCLAALAEIARLRGDWGSAWTAIYQALPDGPESEPGTAFYVRTLALQLSAAALAIDQGELDLAGSWLAAHERWRERGGRRLGQAAAVVLRAEIAQAQGELERALDLARSALDLAATPRQPLALLGANRLVGSLLGRGGDYDLSSAYLQEAEGIAASCGAPYELALVQEAEAMLAQARGDHERMALLCGEISRTAERLGAGPLRERVERLSVSGPLEAHRSGLAGRLTPRELEVLQWLAEGLTDAEIAERLFISPRTVGRHLQSIYGKFNVASRTGAVALAFEHRVFDSPPTGRSPAASGE